MSDIRYREDFSSADAVRHLAERLSRKSPPARPLTIMEVCGTHTMSICRFGIRQLLPDWLRLVSGPGCPVCVSDEAYIVIACELSLHRDVILATFGDLMKVPGGQLSLEKARSLGADIRIVYAPWQCLDLCRANPHREVVFLAVGFETTAPLTASLVCEADRLGIDNLSLLVAHKLVPPAMRTLLTDPSLCIDGFLCPPHVSVVIGANAFSFIAREFDRPCVVAGFEAADIMLGLLELVEQYERSVPELKNLYRRVASDGGNETARQVMARVYEIVDDTWRGLGTIPASGLKIRPQYVRFDAMVRYGLVRPLVPRSPCRCGDVLRGILMPADCPLFADTCTPESPVGPCMVSAEGTCAAYFTYGV